MLEIGSADGGTLRIDVPRATEFVLERAQKMRIPDSETDDDIREQVLRIAVCTAQVESATRPGESIGAAAEEGARTLSELADRIERKVALVDEHSPVALRARLSRPQMV